ncbi:hypothetical protein BNJ_00076 [Kaumoebavirus]|uniref:hypothetical protein n=1 Tax=Kaumoebavirus TaxID=1859492 RepID=UPI0009C27C89|nr:hypothetical protein BNJ_00076 [Kaumoebavirus]ARA71917.1 hypothetical protein BNJ_00076 [Kaumoebavirus]
MKSSSIINKSKTRIAIKIGEFVRDIISLADKQIEECVANGDEETVIHGQSTFEVVGLTNEEACRLVYYHVIKTLEESNYTVTEEFSDDVVLLTIKWKRNDIRMEEINQFYEKRQRNRK